MRSDDALYCPDECESMAKVAGPESRRKETQAGIISGQHLKEFSRMRVDMLQHGFEDGVFG